MPNLIEFVNSDLRIRRHETCLETLPFDVEAFQRAVDELRRTAGEHAPASAWFRAGVEDSSGARTGAGFAAANLVDGWIGFGRNKLSSESRFWYLNFLRDIDTLGVTNHYFPTKGEEPLESSLLTVADLGTLLDLSLTVPFVRWPDDRHYAVVAEVGGGYGRLAEAFSNLFQDRVRFLLIDAVPASMLAAYEYLKSALPTARIGSFYRNEDFDFEKFDIYIMPTWHVPQGFRADLTINVQSMQEMDQHHVDYYLRWMDSVLTDGGLAYLCNRRDHLFRGEWPIPTNWEGVLKITTPRTWLRDMPAELYRRTPVDMSPSVRLRNALYAWDLSNKRAATVGAAREREYRVY